MASNRSSAGGCLFNPDTAFLDCAPWWYLGLFFKAWGGYIFKNGIVHFPHAYPPFARIYRARGRVHARDI